MSSLDATVNGAVKGTDTATVAVIDNTNGATLLSCTVNSTSKNNCSRKPVNRALPTPLDYLEVKVTTSGSSCANKQWRVMFRF